MQHQDLQLPQPRPHSIFCRRRNATRARRHPRLRSTIPDRAAGQIFRDYPSLRGPRDVESQGGRGWKSIGHGCVGDFFLSSPMLHLSRLTTATSSSFLFHLHHISFTCTTYGSFRAAGTQLGLRLVMGPMSRVPSGALTMRGPTAP